jgi:protein-tyrosine phosphatase
MRVLFVCTGNICRSPAAHAVFEAAVARAGLPVGVDSAGTDRWHVGELPERRAREEGARRGYALTHRARQLVREDLTRFDLLLGMADEHVRAIERLSRGGASARIALFRSFEDPPSQDDVADPYYGDTTDFVEMYDVIEAVTPRLLRHVEAELRARAR